MATVFELSEPYRNHLIPVLPPGRGVCAACWTAVDPDFRLCFQCNAARNKFRRRLANVVVPIALAVKREQLAHELWHYKYDVDASVRARYVSSQMRHRVLLFPKLAPGAGAVLYHCR